MQVNLKCEIARVVQPVRNEFLAAQVHERNVMSALDAQKAEVLGMNRFGLRAEPGLSNLLAGNAKASEAARKTSLPGLWLLSAGRVPPNPAEPLGSQRFKDFLSSLGEHFDWVMLHSPPVMAVADAAVVAHACSGVLFVVGAEMASRHAAQCALDQLEAAKARFVGAVLNPRASGLLLLAVLPARVLPLLYSLRRGSLAGGSQPPTP